MKCARFGLLLFAVVSFGCAAWGGATDGEIKIGFWNVENLFDAEDDRSNPGDDEYSIERGWTAARYATKLGRLAEVIAAVAPHALGLAEVENRRVLDDLFAHPSLAPLGYRIAHVESPDKRGIDVALAYRAPFTLDESSVTLHRIEREGTPPTRGVLEAKLALGDEDVTILVNHWPSRGGDRDGSFRAVAAEVARGVVDRIGHDQNVVVVGDLNDDPFDPSVRRTLGAIRSRNAVVNRKKPEALFNPSWEMLGQVDEGTLYYNREWVWNVFDQIIVTRGMLDEDGLALVDGTFRAHSPDTIRDHYRRPRRFRRGRDGEWSEGYSPDPHFWSLIGDSEFREGSLLEAMPDVAERLLGNVTWIIDYNRQNLDGTRIPNEKGLTSRDCDRIQRTAEANGWRVIQVRHGSFREELFRREGGDTLRTLFEVGLSDYDFQVALYKRDAELMRALARAHSEPAADFLEKLSDDEVVHAFGDLGGHDVEILIEALREAKQDPENPCLVIAHTVKGHSLESYADPSNHNSLPNKGEVEQLLADRGLSLDDPYQTFDAGSPEGGFLAERGAAFREGISKTRQTARERRARYRQQVLDAGGLPDSLEIDLSLYPQVHTQWMWGQIAAKIVRIGTQDEGGPILGGKAKPLTPNEQRWNSIADHVLTLSPDVGTSTNIAPLLDQRVYGPSREDADEPVFDARHPELFTQENPWTRHIRFEIAEANCMSAAGSFGKMAHYTGIPSFPIMTVYDFFIKRALDQLYYNLYWGAEFVIIGTPSGVTLSPEGAQHSWKSDIQIPNLITWEPLFAARGRLDPVRRRSRRQMLSTTTRAARGVLVRAVTRGVRAEAAARPTCVARPRSKQDGSVTGTSEAGASARRLDQRHRRGDACTGQVRQRPCSTRVREDVPRRRLLRLIDWSRLRTATSRARTSCRSSRWARSRPRRSPPRKNWSSAASTPT